jgi:hypothetical protein
MGEPIKFAATLRVRCTPALASAVQAAARARGLKTSDWLRDAAQTILCLDGITKYPNPPRSTHE